MTIDLDDYNIVSGYDFQNSQFQLFLTFFAGSTNFTKDQFSNSLDTFEWAHTVSGKINKMNIAYSDVFTQLPNWLEEKRQIDQRGVGGIEQGIRLALRYETYLNTIYSLCESLSKVVILVFPKDRLPHSKKKLPEMFHDQKKWFLKHMSSDPYTKLLANTDWYDEVQAYRSEATHFYSGIITFEEGDIPGYFNRGRSQREGALSEVQNSNILTHISELHDKVKDFLEGFGKEFIDRIDPTASRFFLCAHKKSTCQIFGRTVSFKEFQEGKLGKCSSLDLECPLRERCPAYAAAISFLDTGLKAEQKEPENEIIGQTPEPPRTTDILSTEDEQTTVPERGIPASSRTIEGKHVPEA